MSILGLNMWWLGCLKILKPVSKYEPSFKVVVSKLFSTELQVTMKVIHSPEYKERHMMYFLSFLGVVWVLPMTIFSTWLRWPKSSFGLSVYGIQKCVKTIGLGLKHQCICQNSTLDIIFGYVVEWKPIV